MRLWSLMNALVFRGAPRLTKGSDRLELVRLGVASLLALFRPHIQNSMLPEEIDRWPEIVVAWQKNGDVGMVRKIWTSTCGGVGARDIWDLAHALVLKPKSEHVFITVACLPALAAVSIGGNYGISVATSLSRGIRRHLPSAMVSAENIKEAAAEYVSSEPRAPVGELCRRYLLQLSLGVVMDRPSLMAGVLNHYLKWCGKESERQTAEMQDVVRAMEAEPDRARTYLSACEGTQTINVQRNAADEGQSVVTTMRVVGAQKNQGQHTSSPIFDGGCNEVLRYAERRWEANIRSCEKNV